MTSIDDNKSSVVLERRTNKIEQKTPSMFKVFLLNDDYTPMDFVVQVLQHFFNKDLEAATEVMLKVHFEGKGICGIYTLDIAKTKIQHVVAFAREAGHPLQCLMEKI